MDNNHAIPGTCVSLKGRKLSMSRATNQKSDGEGCEGERKGKLGSLKVDFASVPERSWAYRVFESVGGVGAPRFNFSPVTGCSCER